MIVVCVINPIKIGRTYDCHISSQQHINMLTTTVFLFIVVSVLLLAKELFYHVSRNNKNLPPGPVGVPLLGYLPFLNVFDLGDSFDKLSRRFGNVFSIKVGTELAVVLNDFDVIVKAFSRPELLARPDTFMFRFFSQGQRGIASASGEDWKVQRSFTSTHMKRLAKSNSRMEKLMEEEFEILAREMEAKSSSGTAVEIGYDINASIANTTWAMVSGQSAERTCPRMRNFLKAVHGAIEAASTSGILLFMPFLLKVLPERLFGITKMRQWMRESNEFIKDNVDAQRQVKEASVDGKSGTDSLIGAFLQEASKKGCHKSFNGEQLEVLCSEMFGAGGEPTSVTLRWALRFLAENPDIQKMAHEEIAAQVGQDRKVTLADRKLLPYTQGLVMELIRLSDIHPIGVLHAPDKDTTIEGFTVPKGTFIFPNFHKVHRDPAHWGKTPEAIQPQHWLNDDGEFVPNHRGFLAFGIGPRNCPGQDFARSQLFFYIANFIQRFKFRLTESDNGVECSQGCVVSPKPFDLTLQSRMNA